MQRVTSFTHVTIGNVVERKLRYIKLMRLFEINAKLVLISYTSYSDVFLNIKKTDILIDMDTDSLYIFH